VTSLHPPAFWQSEGSSDTKTTITLTNTSAIETADRFCSMIESIRRISALASVRTIDCPIPYADLLRSDSRQWGHWQKLIWGKGLIT